MIGTEIIDKLDNPFTHTNDTCVMVNANDDRC